MARERRGSAPRGILYASAALLTAACAGGPPAVYAPSPPPDPAPREPTPPAEERTEGPVEPMPAFGVPEPPTPPAVVPPRRDNVPSPSPPRVPQMPQMPTVSYPVGAIGPQCDVFADTAVARVGNGYKVTTTLRNATHRDVRLVVKGTCPGGFSRFQGLPAGYDAYESCAMGPCLGGPPTKTIVLAPENRVVLQAVTIHPRGDTCNAPFDDAGVAVTSLVQLEDGDGFVCASGSAPLRPGSSPPRPTVAPPPKPEPPPAPKRKIVCPRMRTCGLGCSGPFARDANGCELCACAPGQGL